jgi:hypothetical protein
MLGRNWHIAGAAVAALTIFTLPAAAEPVAPILATATTSETLRPQVAALVSAAQAKLRASDVLGAITDLDRAMTQRPTPIEVGVTLTVRGGALYAQGDLDGALADWTRALAQGTLDQSTQLHLVHNIEQIERALLSQ